jgi:hypothetical protein
MKAENAHPGAHFASLDFLWRDSCDNCIQSLDLTNQGGQLISLRRSAIFAQRRCHGPCLFLDTVATDIIFGLRWVGSRLDHEILLYGIIPFFELSFV